MYLGFFKLREMPFRLAPDPRFMCWTGGHSAALACMRGAHTPGRGCAVITGERGAGKTGLVEYLQHSAAEMPPRIDFPPRTQGEFTDWLDDHAGQQPHVDARLLVCDNAHLFAPCMLAALLRASLSTRVVLSGEPALEQALEASETAALSRSCERFRLPALTGEEVGGYIAHRLAVAGAGDARIFGDEACAEVHRETRGNPRLINALCDAAMVVASERELPAVGVAEVRRALEDVGRLVTLRTERADAADAAVSHDRPELARGSVLAVVRVMHGEQLVLERELSSGSMSIGRSADNDLRIDSQYVSRHHCRIVTSPRRSVLEDVQSTNGLYVNARRVRRHRMNHGDVVQIGQHRLHYVELRDAPDAG